MIFSFVLSPVFYFYANRGYLNLLISPIMYKQRMNSEHIAMNTRNNYVQQQPHEPDENNKIPIPFRFLGGSGAFASQLCDVRRCFVCLELSVTDRRSYIPASLTTGMAKANERNAFCRSAPSTLRSFIQCIHFLSPLSPHPVII